MEPNHRPRWPLAGSSFGYFWFIACSETMFFDFFKVCTVCILRL